MLAALTCELSRSNPPPHQWRVSRYSRLHVNLFIATYSVHGSTTHRPILSALTLNSITIKCPTHCSGVLRLRTNNPVWKDKWTRTHSMYILQRTEIKVGGGGGGGGRQRELASLRVKECRHMQRNVVVHKIISSCCAVSLFSILASVLHTGLTEAETNELKEQFGIFFSFLTFNWESSGKRVVWRLIDIWVKEKLNTHVNRLATVPCKHYAGHTLDNNQFWAQFAPSKWVRGCVAWLQTIICPNAPRGCDVNIFLPPIESEPLRFRIVTSTTRSVFRNPSIADKKEQCTYSPFLFFCAKQKKWRCRLVSIFSYWGHVWLCKKLWDLWNRYNKQQECGLVICVAYEFKGLYCKKKDLKLSLCLRFFKMGWELIIV